MHDGSIDWGSLEDGYGSAEEIEPLIGAIAEEDRADEAIAELYGRLVHGGPFSAAPASMRALAAAWPSAARPAETLALLCDLAAHGSTGGVLRAPRGDDLARDVREALAACSDVVRASLAHEDPRVRSAGALLASFESTGAAEALSALIEALARETDGAARASQMLATGLLAAASNEPVPEVATRAGEGAPELVRAVAALAGAIAVVAAGGALNDRELDGITLAASTPSVTVEWFDLGETSLAFPWCHGRVAEMAAEVILRVASSAPPRAVECLTTALRAHGGRAVTSGPDPAAISLANALLSLVLPDRPGEVLLPEDLTPSQIEAAALVHAAGATVNLAQRGLPPLLSDLPRFLGRAPQGPLDARVPVPGRQARWPVWRALRAAANGEIDEGVVESALRGAMSPFEAVQVARDIFSGAYGGAWTDAWLMRRLPTCLWDPTSEVAAEAVEPFARELAATGRVTPVQAAFALTPLVGMAERRGAPLDPALSPLIPPLFYGDRELARRALIVLPAPARERLLIDALPGLGWGTDHVLLAALCPSSTMATFLVEAVRGGAWIPLDRLRDLLVGMGEAALSAVNEALASPATPDALRAVCEELRQSLTEVHGERS